MRIDAPKGTAKNDTEVTYRTLSPLPDAAYQMVPNAVQLAEPVDILVKRGGFAPNAVRMTLRLPDGLPDGAYRSAYAVVYEPRLDQMVPVRSQANPGGHEVVVVAAPHFSSYQVVADVAGKAVKGVLRAGTRVALPWLPPGSALDRAIRDIQDEAVDSLLAVPPKLECQPPSNRADVTTRDATRGQLMSGCAEQKKGDPNKIRIKILNGYAFPMLFWPKDGVSVGLEDLPGDADLFDLVRHLVWMSFDRAASPGPGIAQMTLDSKAKLPLEFNGYLDWGAIGVDAVYYIASTLLPWLKEIRVEAQLIVRELVAIAGSAGSVTIVMVHEAVQRLIARQPAEVVRRLEQIDRVIEAGQCVVQARETLDVLTTGPITENVRGKASAVWKQAYECLKKGLAELGGSLVQTMESIADDLGAFPELLQVRVAGRLRQFGIADTTTATVTIKPSVIQAKAADGSVLPDALLDTVRAVHNAAKRRDYKALSKLMDSYFVSDGGGATPKVTVGQWAYIDPGGKDLGLLVRVLETAPQRLGSTFTYRIGDARATFTKGSIWSTFLTRPAFDASRFILIQAGRVVPWGGHGRSLVIYRDRTGVMSSRAYQECGDPDTPPGEPCDSSDPRTASWVEFRLITASSNEAYAEITKSNEKAFPNGRIVPLTVRDNQLFFGDPNGTFGLGDPKGDWINFCDSRPGHRPAELGACGA